MRRLLRNALLALTLFTSACTTLPPKDYSEFKKSRPLSILVLPPINETTEIGANYSFYSATTRPLAELGYYVLPLVMVDHFFKENGLISPEDIHQAPLEKLREAFGADTVLYITIEKYGSKYQIVASNTFVHARARLVDCRSGVLLWEGKVATQVNGRAGIAEALVGQVLNKIMDQAHVVAIQASNELLTKPGQGLPKGPRSPEYEK